MRKIVSGKLVDILLTPHNADDSYFFRPDTVTKNMNPMFGHVPNGMCFFLNIIEDAIDVVHIYVDIYL